MNPQYIHACNRIFGTHTAARLVETLGSAKAVWNADADALSRAGVSQKKADIYLGRRDETSVEVEWEKLSRTRILCIARDDERYPKLLRETPAPPLGIYAYGNTELLEKPSLAVVGTRRASRYGTSVLPDLIADLVRARFVIVSGLAQGVDTVAHTHTLKSHGETIAVLGCGLDYIYPRLNERLARSIIARDGLIISEYPPGTTPRKHHFPARNRIIAGISLGTLVVESRKRGGSLITARHALEANREVFALPGPITIPTTEGTHNLIQSGAKLVTSAEDIVEELAIQPLAIPNTPPPESLTDLERRIVDILSEGALHIDTIVRMTTLKPQEVATILSALELKGVVHHSGGSVYQCRNTTV